MSRLRAESITWPPPARRIAGATSVARGSERGGLAVVERGDLALGGAVHDEAAAADVAGVRQDDFERKADGDRGVDGIAALLEDVDADLRGERVRGDDHGVRRGDGARPRGPGRGDVNATANRSRWSSR